MPAIEQLSQTSQPQLMKVLALWELIFLGMILIQPTAPVPLFGVAQKLSNGHTVTTILVAMLSPPFAILRCATYSILISEPAFFSFNPSMIRRRSGPGTFGAPLALRRSRMSASMASPLILKT
jgi:hypothetical protein